MVCKSAQLCAFGLSLALAAAACGDTSAKPAVVTGGGPRDDGDGGRGPAVVDTTGPKIVIIQPIDNSVVGGEVDLVAIISDAVSGVDLKQVRAEIADSGKVDTYPLAMNADGKTFSGSFQAATYSKRAQVTINFIAKDEAGNETRAVGNIYLDTVPPWVSLTPPKVRQLYVNASLTPNCSAPFDPVGDDVPDDQETIGAATRFRTIVWERGNALTGALTYMAGVDDPSVSVHVQGDVKVPLLIDTDGDKICDSVNTDPKAPALAPVQLDMTPLKATGNLKKETDDAAIMRTPDASQACIAAKTPGTTPTRLCMLESDLYRVINDETPAKHPVVYAYKPENGAALGCTGKTWETTVAGGWTCVVASAQDNVGNVGISSPLRVCYDLKGKCANPGTPPSCTDGCKMPTVFTKVGMSTIIKP